MAPIILHLCIASSLLALHAAAAAPVTVSVFNNTALAGSPAATYTFPTLDLSFPPPSASFSAEIYTQLAFPTPGYFVFECTPLDARGGLIGFVYVDDHLVCNTGSAQPYANPPNSTDGSQANPIYIRAGRVRPAMVRARLFVTEPAGAASGGGAPFVFGLQWCSPAGPSAGCAPAPLPASALSPGEPPAEASRAALQSALSRSGWGLWLHGDWLALVGLPSGAKLTLQLCRASTGACLETTRTAIEAPGRLRLGLHAHDRSIAQLSAALDALNATVTFLGGAAGAALLIEPAGDCGGNCSDYYAVVTGSFAWGRAGGVQLQGSEEGAALLVSPVGLPAWRLVPTAPAAAGRAQAAPALTASLGGGAIAWVVEPESGAPLPLPPSLAAVQAAAAAAAAAEAARYAPYGALAETAAAAQAAVAWNVIFLPAEAGPVAPVSRSWNLATLAPAAARTDWCGVLFGWDSFFTAYLLGASTRDAAYSTLIQAARSVKAAGGFVSNFQAGGAKSVDRTEPAVGAQVLARVFKKYGDAWLVELLLDDLLDWLDWIWRSRRLEGVVGAAICLGSDAVPGFDLYSSGTMQGARFESGLDNSPMYDFNSFSNLTHHMQLADVGASSLFVAEADALAALATAVNRSADAALLAGRAAAVRAFISAQLWDEQQGAFVNTFPNGTHSRRVSPTSFYALAARAASDAQAARMATEWALNSTRFCLSQQWPEGVSDDCYWGLPSISADDPAFPALGYWRGYVWGPMAQLTYWSFSEYAHVPQVAAARAALVRQMQAMFLAQWRANRHVCENFAPGRNASECTGTKFYTWGALAGLLAIEDAGLY